MAISEANLVIRTQGAEGRKRNLPAGAVHLYRGTLAAQLTASGAVVPLTTASSGHAIGVIQHEADNSGGSAGDKRVEVEADRVYEFENDATNPFTEANLVGAPAYATDDHTVSDTQTASEPLAGFFVGLEESGRVAIKVDVVALGALAAALAADAP